MNGRPDKRIDRRTDALMMNVRMEERMGGPRGRQGIGVLCKTTPINKTQRNILKCKIYDGNI
jgi:hypothetical protein